MIQSAYARMPPTLRGMLLIVISGALFAGMHATIRWVSGGHEGATGLHPFEIAFFRNFFGLLAISPLIFRAGLPALRTTRFSSHAFRAFMQVGSMMMFFSALQLAPLADVVALSFVAPLFATVGAIIFLAERPKLRRWSALIVGFIGAFVILRPGFQEISTGLVLVLASSAIWGLSLLIIKSLSRTDSSVTITAYMGILMTPLSLVPALFVWQMPTAVEFTGLFVIGALGSVGHLALAQAFKEAEATAILPLDFMRLIWAAVYGYVFFAEVPEIWTWLGGGIVFAAATYVAYREAKQGKD